MLVGNGGWNIDEPAICSLVYLISPTRRPSRQHRSATYQVFSHIVLSVCVSDRKNEREAVFVEAIFDPYEYLSARRRDRLTDAVSVIVG
jgi:hypothetical protein